MHNLAVVLVMTTGSCQVVGLTCFDMNALIGDSSTQQDYNNFFPGFIYSGVCDTQYDVTFLRNRGFKFMSTVNLVTKLLCHFVSS